MHYSAKRGIAIVCRRSVYRSVCLSVTLLDQDHTGWKSWKLIARTISPTPSVFAVRMQRKRHPLTPVGGNMEKFGGDYRGGVEKEAFWSTKVAISLKRVKIEERLL